MMLPGVVYAILATRKSSQNKNTNMTALEKLRDFINTKAEEVMTVTLLYWLTIGVVAGFLIGR